MIKIYDSCTGKLLRDTDKDIVHQGSTSLTQCIYYAFMTLPTGEPGFTNSGNFTQIRKIDFTTGDIYNRRTDAKPLINIFNWIAMLNGYPDINPFSEEGKLLGMAMIKSNKAIYYPNIIHSKHFSKWKYKNKKLKIVF